MVGKTGFEPATPWSQTRCTTKLCYFPFYFFFYSNGALGRNRTHNLLIRSQALYPVELLAHINGAQGRSRTGTDFKVRRILSPVRLPISPPGHSLMEVPTGLEPMMTELQSVALPTWPRNHSFVLLRVSYHAAPLLYVNFFYFAIVFYHFLLICF